MAISPTIRRRLRLVISPMLLIMGLFTLSIARAQGPSPTNTPRPVTDNEVNAVSKTLFCPICQNVPLEVCETQACVRWRAQVRDLLAQGYTEAQVRQYFIENFGAQTVGITTDPLGHTLTVVLPLALIIVIGSVVVAITLFWRRDHFTTVNENQPAIHSTMPSDDYRVRLEEELRKRE